MAYFHCLIGGGSSGGGYELTVTCDADFAGTTITCTDGVVTLTATCPSSSPYEVVFEIPNGGDWTISGVVSGQTVATGVSIPTSATLNATIQQTVTIYSAKEDTISYTDIDGATQTITFASGESSKQVSIKIEASGSSITFTSSVAKNPSNLSNDYSKTITIDANTTEVYLMPENALYWYGYQSSDCVAWDSSNGWSTSYSGMTVATVTFSTIYVECNATGSTLKLFGSNSTKSSGTKVHLIAQGVTAASSVYGFIRINSNKVMGSTGQEQENVTSNSVAHYQKTSTISGYVGVGASGGRNSKVYALWYE